MPGTKYGVDRLGRRYKTVNGKRVSVGSEKSSAPKRKKGAPDASASRKPVASFLKHWFQGVKGKQAVQQSVTELLETKFKSWLAISRKTSVGRFGRMYAARLILQALNTGEFKETDKLDEKDVQLLRKMQAGGSFDHKKFFDELSKRGVTIPDDTNATEQKPIGFDDLTDESGVDNDEAILAVVHHFGLDAKQLFEILSQSVDGAETDRSDGT